MTPVLTLIDVLADSWTKNKIIRVVFAICISHREVLQQSPDCIDTGSHPPHWSRFRYHILIVSPDTHQHQHTSHQRNQVCSLLNKSSDSFHQCWYRFLPHTAPGSCHTRWSLLDQLLNLPGQDPVDTVVWTDQTGDWDTGDTGQWSETMLDPWYSSNSAWWLILVWEQGSIYPGTHRNIVQFSCQHTLSCLCSAPSPPHTDTHSHLNMTKLYRTISTLVWIHPQCWDRNHCCRETCQPDTRWYQHNLQTWVDNPVDKSRWMIPVCWHMCQVEDTGSGHCTRPGPCSWDHPLSAGNPGDTHTSLLQQCYDTDLGQDI